MLEELEELFEGEEEYYYIYGDPAYPLSKYLICGFKGDNIPQAYKLFNHWMRKVRGSVEWAFGTVREIFFDYKKHLKLLLQQSHKGYKDILELHVWILYVASNMRV